MQGGRNITQDKKQVVFDLLVTRVGTEEDGKINERVSTELTSTGDVRAIDLLNCAAVMALSLSDALGSEEDFFTALEERMSELKKVGGK